MSYDLEYYKQQLPYDVAPDISKALAQNATDLSNRLSNQNLSDEEKQQLKNKKSELMSTIKYKDINFSDDKDTFLLDKYDSEWLEIDDITATEAVAFAAGLGVTDSVRGIQQLTGIATEELEKEQVKLRKLIQHPEYGGRVLTAYMGGIVADPVTWLLPFVKVAKVATLPQKLKALAKGGVIGGTAAGAVSYVDEQIPSFVREGEGMSRLEQTAIGGLSGGLIAPTIGGTVNAYKYFRGKGDHLPLREVITPEPVPSTIIARDPSDISMAPFPSKVETGEEQIGSLATAPFATKIDDASAIDLHNVAPKKSAIIQPSLDAKASTIEVKYGDDGMLKLNKNTKETSAAKVNAFKEALFNANTEKGMYKFATRNPTSVGGGVVGGVSGWYSVDENASITSKFGAALAAGVVGGATGRYLPRIPLSYVPSGKGIQDSWVNAGFMKPKDIGEIFGDLFIDKYRLKHSMNEGKFNKFISYVDDLSLDQNMYLQRFADLTHKIDKLTDVERKVLYKMLNGEADDMENFLKLRVEARNLIKEFGQLAVESGLLKRETFLQNMNTYIHRTYTAKIQEAANKIEDAAERTKFIKKVSSKFNSVRVIGDEIKPRGLLETTTVGDFKTKWRSQTPGSHLNKISKDAGLDKLADINKVELKVKPEDLNHKGWEFLDDIVPAKELGLKGDTFYKVTQRADLVLDDAGNFVKLGKPLKWEKLIDTDKVQIRWQLTKAQREALGEIEDASFAIRETGKLLAKDITTLNFFNKVARDYGKTESQLIREGLDNVAIKELYDFIPDTPIIGTGSKIDPDELTALKSYGELAGKYVPKEIAREIADIDKISAYLRLGLGQTTAGKIQQGTTGGALSIFLAGYRRANTFWKKTKTAYNPAVHTNNVVSNVLLYDFANASYKHLAPAIKAITKSLGKTKTNLYKLAQGAGLFDKDFLAVEMREVQKIWKNAYASGYITSSDDMFEFLAGSMKNQRRIQQELEKVGMFAKSKNIAFTPLKFMEKLYQVEDHMFRLGVFRDRIEKAMLGKLEFQKKLNGFGLSDTDRAALQKILNGEYVDITKKGMENVKSVVQYAKNEGVKWFIDYDIQAPGINALRATATPFLAYSYRVVGLISETALTRPTKLMKWAGLGYLIDLAGNNIQYDVKRGDFTVSDTFGGSMDFLDYEDPGTTAERLLMREQDRGNLFGMPFFPNRMLKVPITIDGVPQYLDVTRWTPGGDIFDSRQGHGDIPYLPQPLQPSFGAIGSVWNAFSGYDAFRGQPIPGHGVDAWWDAQIAVKKLAFDFLPNIVVLGIDGHGSYSYLKVRQALARQGKEGLFNLVPGVDIPGKKVTASPLQDDLTVLQALGHTFGIKLIPVEYQKLQARKRIEMSSKLESLVDHIRDAAKKMQKGVYTREKFDEVRQEAIEKRNELVEEYSDIFKMSSSEWSRRVGFKDPMKDNPMWPFESERERQERHSMMWEYIEDHPTLYSGEKIPSTIKLIDAYSEKYNVDSKVIQGIVVAESKFDPNAIGDKNLANRAYGLMQVRKPALDDVNEFYNLNYTEKDLLDPQINLEVGIAYFAMQRDKYGIESTEDMIQSYNAGPGNKSLAYLKKVKDDINREFV